MARYSIQQWIRWTFVYLFISTFVDIVYCRLLEELAAATTTKNTQSHRTLLVFSKFQSTGIPTIDNEMPNWIFIILYGTTQNEEEKNYGKYSTYKYINVL